MIGWRPLLALLVLAFAAVPATGRPEAPEPDLVILHGATRLHPDPALIDSPMAEQVHGALREGLVRRDGATLAPRPALARRWSVSDDGLVWTFTLDPEARWTDGRRVRAEDVVRGWLHVLDAATASPWAHLLDRVRHARAHAVFPADVARLGGEQGAIRRLQHLREQSPDGLDAEAWHRARHTAGLDVVLATSEDPLLRGARDLPGLTPQQLLQVVTALAAERERRRRAALAARQHLGVDEGVFAPDAGTLVVELLAPTPWLLDVLTAPALVPRHPQGLAETNGPFRLAAPPTGGRWVLERWAGHPHARFVDLARVAVEAEPDAAAALAAFRAGAADVVVPAPPEVAPDDPALREVPAWRTQGLVVVGRGAERLDAPARRLLAGALDRRAAAEAVGGRPLARVVPPGAPGPTAASPAPGWPAAASADLRPRRVHLRVPFMDALPAWESGILRPLADLGIETILAGEGSAPDLRWVARRGAWLDATAFLLPFATGGRDDVAGWHDEVYDALLAAADRIPYAGAAALEDLPGDGPGVVEAARALAAADGEDAGRDARGRSVARSHLLAAAEGRLLEAAVVMPAVQDVTRALVGPRVRGWRTQRGDGGPNLLGHHPLRELGAAPR